MKRLILWTTILSVIALLSPAAGLADNTGRTNDEVVGVVVEYTPGGEYIQIGDTTTAIPLRIYLDNGEGEQQVGSSSLALGQVILATLSGTDDSGMVQAEKLTILEGEGLAKVLDTMDEDARTSLASTAGSRNHAAQQSEDGTARNPGEQDEPVTTQEELRMEDGVWKN